MNKSFSENLPFNFDRLFHAFLGKLTYGLSPSSLLLAYYDWILHLSYAPAKQIALQKSALNNFIKLALYISKLSETIDDKKFDRNLLIDKRFLDKKWQEWPFNIYYNFFLLNQSWWNEATTQVNGVSEHHENAVNFVARQILDMFSPSNYLFTNPEILSTTVHEGGNNLIEGLKNFTEDWERIICDKSPLGTENYLPGKQVAITPGEVIYRNHLIELIQYKPTTRTVYKEPILIVPAWIMKYYILDLSPENSLVKYLISKGHTVFMISWRNPDVNDRDLELNDYHKDGVNIAIETISNIIPKTKIHTVGYCLGGTLLSIAVANFAREDLDIIASMTLLAAQTDFEEAGELMLFIDESQVTFLEDIMWEQGYLDTKQMASSFYILRSNDLIWSTIMHEYFLGKRTPMTDLMSWSKDTTRMPYKMHSQYLRKLFLNNELAEHRYYVNNRPIAISDIRAPIFTVATIKDHVSPWKSVFKIHLLTDTEVSFLLTSGGHNVGIISEPENSKNWYKMSTHSADDKYIDPDSWLKQTEKYDGSWWLAWQKWLVKHSSKRTGPPKIGSNKHPYKPICSAPGTYVHCR